ncbi:unnamed protein product [Cylindrotheca closterium]|uniref:K Homology domain-containing protein n=1 Tax=Cylindrotheca closterium TaxID=2856 RepID=A0AAD2FZL6_9STRA|nr:unnamed protein product [Cylindrotheca closterium]
MPPRRRNKANSARSAAIRAVRKRQGDETVQNTFMNNCRFPNPKMNQCVPIPDKKTSVHHENDDDEDVPDLLDHNDDKITDGDYDSRGEDYISEDEEDEDVEDEEDDEGCLHCHSMSNDIQVHCDECQAYVCEECHWCHEYQANHEIRVCDRCDAFYCRGCDEMDQCEDCGEVVCASCSTLLSCKFCGGGLCEECATACGRCGIVLCSRDAKFAVECDTCRLSYCLVCLASGSKDPCVRCGHRPSKRMEQLVHLRLKSIYKAFKQSSSNPSGKMGPYGGHAGHAGRNTTTIEELEDYDGEDYEPDSSILMAAKAASGHMSDPTTSALHYAAREMDLEHALVENYIQEKQKADAAAEALLAELEEEEEAAKSKKSKKKKKKERQQAIKREEEEKKRHEDEAKAKKAAEQARKFQKKQEAKSRKKDASSMSASPSDQAASLAPKQSAELGSQFDEIEVKLCQLIENGDCEGIDEILFALKGVPGRAALRKNAKKALKRLRAKDAPDEAEEVFQNKLPIKTTESISSKSMKTPPSVPPKNPPKIATTNTTGTRLKVVSGTHASKSNRDECVMQMSSTLVGWVIGKGGQRIRDMMEESGAKIWIDQEKAKAPDCRNVYVSGERKCVEKAVKMVHELVNKAPIGQHQQQTEHLPQTNKPSPIPTQKHSIQEPSKPPVATVQKQAEPGAIANEPARLVDATPAVNSVENPIHLPEPAHDSSEMDQKPAFQQMLTCEACFVPLLIGKRGWTIKNIQDESGARVDIDQAVTPRQIRVSGSKANVEIAIRMVRDVLSYPHAQLQQPADTEGSQAHPSHLIPDANGLLSASSSHSATPEHVMRTAQPPYSMPPGQMIPPSIHHQQMSMNRTGARPVHPGLSAGPPFLMGPPPSITGIGMPPQLLQGPPPQFYGQRDGGIGQVQPPGDFMMGGGMRGVPPSSAGLPQKPVVPMAPPSQQQHQQFPQFAVAMDAAGGRPGAPQSQGLWNPPSSSYMNGDGLNAGRNAAPAAAASKSLFVPGPGPESALPVRQQDSDLIDSLFGPADKSKADDAQIDALFGLSALSIDDNNSAATGELGGLWGPSSLTELVGSSDPADATAESSSKNNLHQQQPQQQEEAPPSAAALPGLTESFLQRGGPALQHPPESRFDWSSMG